MATKKLDLVTWLKNWFESKTNKVTSLSSSSTDTEYPTAKAVYDAIQNSGGCVEDYYFDTTTKEIIIDYVCGSGSGGSGGSVVIDDSWITDSTNPVQSKIIKLALDGKAANNHTHSQYLTEHQSLANYIQKSQTAGLIKNDGTIDSTSYSTFSGSYSDLSNKPSYTATVTSSTANAYKIGSINISGSNVDIYAKDTDTQPPSASTTTPSADTTSGSYGSGTTYARANHTHPKSTLYAEASHTHSAYVNPTIADNLTTNDSSQVLSAKQGKVLNDLIGSAITYINQ